MQQKYAVQTTSCIPHIANTIRYKILEGEKFGKLKEIRQNFLVQNFPLKILAS